MFAVYYMNDKVQKTNDVQTLADCAELENEGEIAACELSNAEIEAREDCLKSPYGFSCYAQLLDNNWDMNY